MFPGSFACRLPLVASLYACGDACELACPETAAAACACSPACQAAASVPFENAGDSVGSLHPGDSGGSSGQHGGSPGCCATASSAAAAAALRRQLDPHNAASRAHYRSSLRHGGLPADRICCVASEGDSLGMSDTAVRWTLEWANRDDAAERAAAARAGDAHPLREPLLVLGTGSAAVSLRSAAGSAAPHSPLASVWADDAAMHFPGAPAPPFPPLAAGETPFHRTDVLHTSHGNVLASTPWFVAVDRCV